MAHRWRRYCWHFWRERKSVRSNSWGKEIPACSTCRRRWAGISGGGSGSRWLRPLVAGSLVVLAFFTGTAALGSFVASRTVLDADRAGEVLSSALDQAAPSAEVLGRLVPAYSELKPSQRGAALAAARSAQVRAAAREVTFDDAAGEIDLTPLRRALVTRLRDGDQPGLARQVEQDSRDSVVTVPGSDLSRYRSAVDAARSVALWGGAATLLLFAGALLVSRDRAQTCRSIGITTLLSAALVGAGYWLLPDVAEGAGTSATAKFAAVVIQVGVPTAVGILVPVAVVAVLLIAVPTVTGRRKRRSSDAG